MVYSFSFINITPNKILFFRKISFWNCNKKIGYHFWKIYKSFLARRGKILDRNGYVLAEDIPSYEIGLDLNNFSFNPNEIKKISYLLDIDKKKFIKRLSDKKKKYLVLKRNATSELFSQINRVGIFFTAAKFNVS